MKDRRKHLPNNRAALERPKRWLSCKGCLCPVIATVRPISLGRDDTESLPGGRFTLHLVVKCKGVEHFSQFPLYLVAN
ncbi:MAG: hypothetical protein F6K11_15970 [Leptolyngbya sp. SIO3F4]|nr:hypothetical protein [Leptolyngbya sp. SIO3F4]